MCVRYSLRPPGSSEGVPDVCGSCCVEGADVTFLSLLFITHFIAPGSDLTECEISF